MSSVIRRIDREIDGKQRCNWCVEYATLKIETLGLTLYACKEHGKEFFPALMMKWEMKELENIIKISTDRLCKSIDSLEATLHMK